MARNWAGALEVALELQKLSEAANLAQSGSKKIPGSQSFIDQRVSVLIQSQALNCGSDTKSLGVLPPEGHGRQSVCVSTTLGTDFVTGHCQPGSWT